MKVFLIGFFLMAASLVSPQAEAAEIRVFKKIPYGAHISLRGDLKIGDADKLEALVKPIFSKYRRNTRIALYLTSAGGPLYTMRTIAIVIRKYGIATVVPKNKSCDSACAFIFMTGWDRIHLRPHRIKHPRAKLGVHHPHNGVPGEKAGKFTMDRLRRFFWVAQAGKGMYELTRSTPPDSIRYIKNRELQRMGGYTISRERIKWPYVAENK